MVTTQQKAAGVYEDCGKVVAVFYSADGPIVPIGTRSGCACGNTEFRIL